LRERLWIHGTQLGFSANVAVGASLIIVELLSSEMNEGTMVSALKVGVTFAFEVFIDDALQRVGGPKRQDRTRLAIGNSPPTTTNRICSSCPEQLAVDRSSPFCAAISR
jgi:hypothetical protein